MSNVTPANIPIKGDYTSDSDMSDGQARGNRKPLIPTTNNNGGSYAPQQQQSQGGGGGGYANLPTSVGLQQPAGQLLKGATDANGRLKDPALLVGIKLDLEAEVHLTARVRGDICVGLY